MAQSMFRPGGLGSMCDVDESAHAEVALYGLSTYAVTASRDRTRRPRLDRNVDTAEPGRHGRPRCEWPQVSRFLFPQGRYGSGKQPFPKWNEDIVVV